MIRSQLGGLGRFVERNLMRLEEFMVGGLGSGDVALPFSSLKQGEMWPRQLPSLLAGGQNIAPLPKLVFPLEIFRRLDLYYREISQEFQLMGLVDHNEESNLFVVTELVLNSHSAGMAHAEMDEGTLPDLLDKLEKEGKDIRKLRLQCHSHGRLDSYFSSIDLQTIRDEYVCDWMISVVGNTARDYKARLDIFSPVPVSIALPIFVQVPELSNDVKRNYIDLLKESMGLRPDVIEFDASEDE